MTPVCAYSDCPEPALSSRPWGSGVAEVTQNLGIVDRRAALRNLDMTPAFDRGKQHEDISRAIVLVFVVVMRRLSWPHGVGLNLMAELSICQPGSLKPLRWECRTRREYRGSDLVHKQGVATQTEQVVGRYWRDPGRICDGFSLSPTAPGTGEFRLRAALISPTLRDACRVKIQSN